MSKIPPAKNPPYGTKSLIPIKEFAKGEEYAMAERGRRKAPFMPQSATADAQRLKKREQEMEQAFPTMSVPDINLALENVQVLIDSGLEKPSDCLGYRTVVKCVERIADHAGLIAKKVKYLKSPIDKKILKEIDEISKESLILKEYFAKFEPGEELSYLQIENESGVKMDNKGKGYMRTALKNLKLGRDETFPIEMDFSLIKKLNKKELAKLLEMVCVKSLFKNLTRLESKAAGVINKIIKTNSIATLTNDDKRWLSFCATIRALRAASSAFANGPSKCSTSFSRSEGYTITNT